MPSSALVVFLTSTFLSLSSGFRDLTLELQSEPRRARVTWILAQGQNITKAEVVDEGWGWEIVLWRGSALYPAGVWICVHKYVCVWMCVYMFMWVTVYMCEGVCVCVSECLYVYYCMCVSLCVYVWVCVCECLYVYYWTYESVCVCVSVCVEGRLSLSLSQKPKEMWQGAWRPQHIPDSSAEVFQVPSCDSAIWLTIVFTLQWREHTCLW